MRGYYITFNSEWIVDCLDLGYVSLVNKDVPKFICDMRNKRLCALRVHDTNLREDSHQVPFCENMDYLGIAKTLGEIDYKGDFTFEAYNFFSNKPVELLPASYKYACEVGRYLIREIEKNRK